MQTVPIPDLITQINAAWAVDPVATRMWMGGLPEETRRALAEANRNSQPWLEGRPTLHAGQAEIKSNAGRFNVVNCGRRFGKSILGEDLAMDTALSGKPVGWFSPDYKSLLENWRSLLRILAPVTSRRSELEKRIELTTGGVIECWSLDSDPECSRGRKYARVIIDEAAKVRWLMRAWLEAIRANLADYEGDAWFFSTPKGRNDYWELYQRSQRDDPQGWRSWKRPTSVNPFILPSEIEAMRLEMGPRIASQEIDAEFLEVGGRFFDEWVLSNYNGESVHEIWSSSLVIPKHWEAWGGFDHGSANPSAFGLLVSDGNGDVVIIDEYYKALDSNEDQVSAIKRVCERNGYDATKLTIFADPAIFPPKDPVKRVGRYTVEDFWSQGLKFVPANNERVDGWKRIRQYMKARTDAVDADGVPVRNPDGTTKQYAGLRVFKDKCPNLIRTIPLMVALERGPNANEDLDTTLEDHAVDGMLRYGIQRPRPSGPPPAVESATSSIGQYLIGHKKRTGGYA